MALFANLTDLRNYINTHIIDNNQRLIKEEHVRNMGNGIVDFLGGDAYIHKDGSVEWTNDQSLGGHVIKNGGQPLDQSDLVRLQDLNQNTQWRAIEW